MIEKHVEVHTASETLGLGFETSSLIPEPAHPVSEEAGALPYSGKWDDTGRQGLDLEP